MQLSAKPLAFLPSLPLIPSYMFNALLSRNSASSFHFLIRHPSELFRVLFSEYASASRRQSAALRVALIATLTAPLRGHADGVAARVRAGAAPQSLPLVTTAAEGFVQTLERVRKILGERLDDAEVSDVVQTATAEYVAAMKQIIAVAVRADGVREKIGEYDGKVWRILDFEGDI